MKRKDIIREAMQAPTMMDVFLTEQEHAVLAKHGTTYRRYIEGEQPQTFVIHGTTEQEEAEAEALEAVISKLDRLTGKNKTSIVVFIKDAKL